MTDEPNLPGDFPPSPSPVGRRSHGGRHAHGGRDAQPGKAISIRLNTVERAAIEAAARTLEVSVTDLVRAGALVAADYPAALPQEALAVHRAGQELAAGGRLLNQIARSLQSDDEVGLSAVRAALIATQDRTERLRQAFRAMLNGQASRGRLARDHAERAVMGEPDDLFGAPPK